MQFKSQKEKMFALANLMNEGSETPLMVSDDLLYPIDAALEPEEVDFLLKMGGGTLTRSEIEQKVEMSGGEFNLLFETLLDKGPITEMEPEKKGNPATFHLMSIFPGWFELYLMRGAETPDRKAFSRRLSKYFSAAQEFDPELINEIIRELGPHRSIAVVNPSQSRLISVDESAPPLVNEIHPPQSIMNILEKIDEDEIFALGHCFCRQQRKLDGDPCRMHLPDESCMSLGPAAEHLIKRNIARRITKAEAIRFIQDVEEKGAVHQVGRLVPLKDFKAKYEVDVICNCCWDCCGAFGNYNRGNTPFILNVFYIAEIPDETECTGCGTCEEFCPVRAISLGEEGVAKINPEMCCGCGLCTVHCPVAAVHLKPFKREVFLPILERSKRRAAFS